MSLIVTVWTTEGIVMGSDSRISFSSQIGSRLPKVQVEGNIIMNYDK